MDIAHLLGSSVAVCVSPLLNLEPVLVGANRKEHPLLLDLPMTPGTRIAENRGVQMANVRLRVDIENRRHYAFVVGLSLRTEVSSHKLFAQHLWLIIYY